ncbi:hypothetical protein BGZ68_006798 [Mortierella alpina]|nr:hypothetical protein BGZ68_006798 [Mortierella alpina]
MVPGRRRTLSNLNGELQYQSQKQLRPSMSSLLRPIVNLLTVDTTARCSEDDPLQTASGCEDLPSPIYGRYGDGEKIDNDYGGKEMHYAVEASTLEPFEPPCEFSMSVTRDTDTSVADPDSRSLSTSDLMVLESGLQRKVGAIASSGEVIDTPLMNLQEQGYVVVRFREFDGPMAEELSVDTTCGRLDSGHGEGSPVAMSASLDERYWQPSVSIEDLAGIRPPSSQDTAENLLTAVLTANMATQDLSSASNLAATVPDGIVPVGDECSQAAYVAEEPEHNRDGSFWKRLWNTGVLELDANLDLEQESIQGDSALQAKHGCDIIAGGTRPLDTSWEARLVENLMGIPPQPEYLGSQGSDLNLGALVPLPESPVNVLDGESLMLLPPLPPSPAESVCITPKSLEIASTKAQLRYWSRTAARLRDQEEVLTARIDVLIQEMAQVLDKCQETELGLLAKETIVQELRRELVKEQEFGFASVQEAALSIQEKCFLENALEESWKELGVLREAWVHQQQVLRVSLPHQEATVSAFKHKSKTASVAEEKPSPSEQGLNLQEESPCVRTLVNMSTPKRSAPSTFFHTLVKLLCLALICTMALVSMVVLLYGQQHHLHQVYQTLSRHASKFSFDARYAYRQFEAVAEEVFSHVQVLLQRKQKSAEDHVHSMTELFWTAAELWTDMDMAELWQSLQISRTWS